MKKWKYIVSMVLLGALLYGATVLAAGAASPVEIQQKDDQVMIYVKGIDGDVTSAEAYTGNKICEAVNVQEVSEIQTLILIDNSLSIPEADRNNIKEEVKELIAARSGNELFAVGTFSDNIRLLVNFSNDYTELKEAVDEIVFEDQETYLTDVLYELIRNGFVQNDRYAYRRILIISDGVDNKSIGYTKEELKELLGETPIPVYAIGVYNRQRSNSQELENMFALSRSTNAEGILLEDLGKDGISKMMSADRSVLCFAVTPGNEEKDGSRKTITIHAQTTNGEEIITADNVRIILKADEADFKEASSEELEPEKVSSVKKSLLEKNVKRFIISAVLAVVIILLMVILFLFLRKKKGNKKALVPPIENDPPKNDKYGDERTFFIGNEAKPDDSSTMFILENETGYQIILTNVDSPAISYRGSIQDSLIIGKASGNVNICIEGDNAISRRHCEILRDGNRFYIRDLQSSNGTYLDGKRVTKEMEIYTGSILRLGRTQLQVKIE